MEQTELNRPILSLVRLGIGHSASNLSESADLAAVKALAAKQGLSAVVLDGLNDVRSKREDVRCSSMQEKILLAEWIGEVHQYYEQRYEQYLQAISSLAKFYNSHGFKMMILKGYACSLDWPKPNHRPCGDIDIWLFGKQKDADLVLAKEKGIEIDKSHQHHTVFTWRDFLVENHYDFGNVYHHKSSVELEKIFKELGKDDSYSVELYGEKVYLPSPNLHALFLLKHSMTDFAAFFVTLRQVLDWAFHVEKHSKEIDWDWLLPVLDKFHMMDFFNCVNAICVEDLGFEPSIFPYIQYNPALKRRVLVDILEPKFSRESPRHLLPRLIHKYRRWKGNTWKHKMCYNESLWSGFWSGVWNHLLKPSSI